MNSFKKIALAMVAAMTLGTIVASPASAAVMSVAVSLDSVANTTASSISTPASLTVPADNSVDAADALKFVATVDTGTNVSVVATNATIVSALHTSAASIVLSAGTGSVAGVAITPLVVFAVPSSVTATVITVAFAGATATTEIYTILFVGSVRCV